MSWGMLYYVLGSPPPLWGQGVREAPSWLPSLPAHPLLPLSIPGSLEPPWGLRKPPACSPRPLSISGSLEPSWASGSPQLIPLAPLTPSLLPSLPAHFPHSQLAPLAPSLLSLVLLLPAYSELAPLSPSLLPACLPCSQLASLISNGQGRVGVCYTMF